ncbi:MAG: restriction endonuclease [Chromatiales bacterium 21-64-14]|nr:MAG: restriction endonuclease [Chromatiales bacterium 21-64-14]
MIPDYQTLMRPVLECASSGEARISDVVELLANKLGLTAEERGMILPSGKQTRFANRVNWAKSYLKQGGLVEITGRGRYKITDRGLAALANKTATIDNAYLAQFEEFQNFKSKEVDEDVVNAPTLQGQVEETESTPDEALRRAHGAIIGALSAELLDRVRNGTPAFFEKLIVQLLIAMGYGGTSEEAGRAIGQSGDNGVDGVIDQDPLGVDQIYVQAKRYGEGNNVAAGAIRDFYGALSLKRAHKGIFVTTSTFSTAATETARGLGLRIVLIDGPHLGRLMIRYNVGCRDEEIIHLKKLDEDFFEPT